MNFQALEEDLKVFSDLGTAPVFQRYPGHTEFRWVHDRNELDGVARLSPAGELQIEIDGRWKGDYRSFLASPYMADLRSLAAQIQTREQVDRSRSERTVRGRRVYAYDWYVDSRVSTNGSNVMPGPASSVLAQVVDHPNEDVSTRVVFLTALAGQGKSSVLRRFTRDQALRFQSGESDSLAFYVDAQGRGMSQLNEAIAFQLNELRFPLPHEALIILVREGLVTLIVDGFDELIGSRGTYDDAFSSLTNFLVELQGRGTLIAAARSSYFTQEYRSREHQTAAGVFSGVATSTEHFELIPWSDADQRSYLNTALGDAGISAAEEAAIIASFARWSDSALLGRPLFCRDFLQLLLQGGPEFDGSQPIIEFVISSIIEREAADKLRIEQKQVIPAAVLRRYFELLASELWQLETREVDEATAKALMDLVLQEAGVEGEIVEVLSSRIAYLALISPGQRRNTVEFEHEIFFEHFLARSIADVVIEARTAEVSRVLSKAAIEVDAAEGVARALRASGLTMRELLQRMSEVGVRPAAREAQVRRNAGSIVCAALRVGDEKVADARISNLSFVGESFSGVVLERVSITNVEFSRADLRASSFIDCSVAGVTLVEPWVDSSATRLELSGLDWEHDIVGIRVSTDLPEADRVLFAPQEVAEVLQAIGVVEIPRSSDVSFRHQPSESVLALVDRLCRAYERMTYVGSKHGDYAAIFNSPDWKTVRNALLELDLIEETQRGASGPAQTFYRRRFRPVDLMGALVRVPVDPRIDDFWAEVSE